MLSEISQRKTNALFYHLCVKSKKVKQMDEYNKTETRLIENKLVVTSGEREQGLGKIGVGD